MLDETTYYFQKDARISLETDLFKAQKSNKTKWILLLFYLNHAKTIKTKLQL